MPPHPFRIDLGKRIARLAVCWSGRAALPGRQQDVERDELTAASSKPG
jgi:hypothetical protein